jgi:hypothetical protein
MSPIATTLNALCAGIARRTAGFGRPVDVAGLNATDRHDHLALAPPGIMSPNGSCRLVRAADGWIAVNLARDDDRALVPAWLGEDSVGDIWAGIMRIARKRDCAGLIAGATVLGLPVSRADEAEDDAGMPRRIALGRAAARQRVDALRVVDLSALWAGPLCGAVFAAMGASVTRIESTGRPDPTRAVMPQFHRRLNGLKTELMLDLSSADGRAALHERVLAADVVITSARPRAFQSLELSTQSVFAANPALVWVAITGHGWTGAGAARVAFGDDAAAAGGLIRWTDAGEPRFLGDALADPLTGLCAALTALDALAEGGGALIDAALARCAALAARDVRRERAR